MRLAAGHRVGVLTGTTDLHVALHAAAHRERFVLVPLSLRDTPRAMVAHLDAAGAEVLVADPAHADLAREVRGHRPVLVCDADGRPASEVAGDLPPPRPDGSYAVLRTSGTTHERLVDIPRAALQAHAGAACQRLGAAPDSLWLATLPMWHIGGVALVHRCLHGGGRLVLQDRFDAAAALGAMRERHVSHVSLVPTMLHRLLALRTRAPPSLRCVLVGGDRLAPDLVQQALAAGWPVHASYGLTEACSQVTTATPDELRADPATCGQPLDGVRVRVCGPGGDTLGPDEAGEIVVDGPTLAVAGPLCTGDLGRLDAEGRLQVLGRADDRITTGGEKVDPERVEAVLCAHPDVADAAAVGVPDREWGQRVVALVVAAQGARADPRSLVLHARARLPVHAVPKEIRVAHALPRTQTGKLRRAAVRAQWGAAGT